MPQVAIAFDTTHDHDAMTVHLRAQAAAYPRLYTLTSIAKTFRGRDVWFMTITDTGPILEKPGLYIHSQIHAEGHATLATAFYACWYLLAHYGTDDEVTRLVDSQTFYIIPRINPDGGAYAPKAPYHAWCGNGRCLPGQDRIDGLVPQDLTGDGYIVKMRVPYAWRTLQGWPQPSRIWRAVGSGGFRQIRTPWVLPVPVLRPFRKQDRAKKDTLPPRGPSGMTAASECRMMKPKITRPAKGVTAAHLAMLRPAI